MSLTNFDPALLYVVGYVALAVAASVLLSSVFANMGSARMRKGQQHPLGWRNSVKS